MFLIYLGYAKKRRLNYSYDSNAFSAKNSTKSLFSSNINPSIKHHLANISKRALETQVLKKKKKDNKSSLCNYREYLADEDVKINSSRLAKPQIEPSRTAHSSPKATSVSSSCSTARNNRRKTEENNLVSLLAVLENAKSINDDIFTFTDYLSILKQLKLVSCNSLTQKEENLVTRSWHQISYYQGGNIITDSNNIRIFISGILGITETWMFKQVTIFQ